MRANLIELDDEDIAAALGVAANALNVGYELKVFLRLCFCLRTVKAVQPISLLHPKYRLRWNKWDKHLELKFREIKAMSSSMRPVARTGFS